MIRLWLAIHAFIFFAFLTFKLIVFVCMNISSEMLAHDQGQSHYIAYDNFSKWEKNPEVISKKCNLMLQLYLVKKCVNTEWDVREIFIVLLKLWSKYWAIPFKMVHWQCYSMLLLTLLPKSFCIILDNSNSR